jgi:hypothetical protein
MTNKRRKSNRKKRKAQFPAQGLSVSLTLSPEMAARLQRYEKHLRRLRPNVPVTRAGMVRALIDRALAAFERDQDERARDREPKPLIHR